MIKVVCLDDNTEYYFAASTPYEAMKKMRYTLDITNVDKNANINLYNARTLAMEHSGKMYSCLIQEVKHKWK